MVTNQYIAANCQCAKLRSASRIITRFYDDALKEAGIKSGQFTLLVAVELCQSISITELSEALAMDRTTLTRNLNPLVNEGLIEMKSGRGRTRLVSISEGGHKVLTLAKPLWESAQARVTEIIGESGSGALSVMLKRMKVGID